MLCTHTHTLYASTVLSLLFSYFLASCDQFHKQKSSCDCDANARSRSKETQRKTEKEMFKCEWLMQNNMTFTHVCCRSTNNQQKVRKRHDQKICFQGMSLQLIAWKRKCIGKVRIWRNSMTHSKMQPPIFFVCVRFRNGILLPHFEFVFYSIHLREREKEKTLSHNNGK